MSTSAAFVAEVRSMTDELIDRGCSAAEAHQVVLAAILLRAAEALEVIAEQGPHG